MHRFSLRIPALAAGFVALGLALSGESPGAASSTARARLSGMPVQRAVSNAMRRSAASAPLFRGRYGSIECTSDFGTADGTGYFLGVTRPSPEPSNVAAGLDSFVVGGANNEACDEYDGVGAGSSNVVGNGGVATRSFIGGGSDNYVTGNESTIGAGLSNLASGSVSFVGAGTDNAAAGNGAFVGAGNSLAHGNVSAYGNDAFIGSGDLDQIDSNANGSFVGAGGYEWASVSCGSGCNAPGNDVGAVDAFVGAGDLNVIATGANGSFIGAGGYNNASTKGEATNAIGSNAYDAFIGAGDGNKVSGAQGFVGAGGSNSVAAKAGFVGGGSNNAIASAASFASIIGGLGNSASGTYASVIGGYGNTASGAYAIVAGGNSSTASGTLTYAAGYHAKAAHNGSFVWSDYVSGSSTIADAATNQYVVRASGGTTIYSNEGATAGVSLTAGSGSWASLSDRNAKTGVAPLDDASILAKVKTLPISSWTYDSEPGVRHVGPMAQDFYAAFGTGADDRHITSIDEDGVALAAVKAVNAKLDRENFALRTDARRKNGTIAALERANANTRSRLAMLELKVDSLASHDRR